MYISIIAFTFTLGVGFTFLASNNNEVALANASKNNSQVTPLEEKDTAVTKEDIHYKMLNSIQFYEKAKGSFIFHSDSLNEDKQVDYNVKVKNGAFSKVKVISNNSSSYESMYSSLDQTYTEENLDEKNYWKMKAAPVSENSKEIPKTKLGQKEEIATRYSQKNGIQKVYTNLPDPSYMGYPSISLYPQDVALGYLEDYNNWDIVSNNEKLNNLDVVVIQGNLNRSYQEKHGALTFKLWVQKDTGILLKLEEYNGNGKTVESLKTTDIKLDSKVTDQNYKIAIPSNFKEVKPEVGK